MTQHVGTTSVFTDDSGTRRVLLLWTLRGVIAAIVLAAGAVAFTLATGVPLPSLGGPLGGGNGSSVHGAGSSTSKHGADPVPAAPSQEPTAGATTAADRGAAAGSSASAGPGSKPSSAPTTVPSATPTASATHGAKANRGGNSADAPRATPTRDPHVPIKTPPGRIK